MNRNVAMLAMSLPLMAILGVMVSFLRHGGPEANDAIRRIEQAEPDEPVAPVAPVEQVALPAWVSEPLPYEPTDLAMDLSAPVAAAFRNARDVEAQMQSEIRSALAEDFDRMISMPAINRREQDVELRERYANDPDWPRIPAVPEVSGFEIQDCTGYELCLSDLLADEADDAAWARPMESSIYGLIARAVDTPPGQLHVVCRETTCGVLMASSSQAGRQNLVAMGRVLSEELGFQNVSIAERSNFQAIYLTMSEVDALYFQ